MSTSYPASAVTTVTTLELGFTGPYERENALALIAAHAVPGAERVNAAEFTASRLIDAGAGPVHTSVTLGRTSVTATVSSGDAGEVAAVASGVRFWLDLDLDPQLIVEGLGHDALLGSLVAARPGLRVVGHPSGYEAAICTVLGQQVSLASARTFAGRLVAAFGETGPGGLLAFPSAATLADVEVRELRAAVGLTGARSATVLAMARECAEGLELRPGVDLAATRAALLSIPGIGPWTADYLAVRALGDRDAYPAGDLVLRRALGVKTAAQAEALAGAWRPLRAYAVMHIWTAAVFV